MLRAQEPTAPQRTGRYVVVFRDPTVDVAGLLASAAGVTDLAHSREFAGQAVDAAQVDSRGGVILSELGVAVVQAQPEQIRALQDSVDAGPQVLSVAPEQTYHVLTPPAPPFQDTAELTWGLQAVRAGTSPRTGAGIKVAMLDTGFEMAHPDFAGRQITAQSFVSGLDAQDRHGHGTHVTGTACGPAAPAAGRRYGVAGQAQIFVGKVLNDSGSGTDANILAGINWAITNACDVVSMSLGADVPDMNPTYTAVGSRALDRGTLIVAAAGNNANRPGGNPGLVGAPANSPYILAVAALDQQLAVAPFSARSGSGPGGQVDLAGPGVDVYSSWILPDRYQTISGTSMATPHVAGLAALWAQESKSRGRELWAILTMESQRLLAPSADVGSGLLLAPQ